MKLDFSQQFFSKNTQISNLMTIRSVGAELFHTDGQTDVQTDGQTYRRTDGQTDRWKDRHIDGRTERQMDGHEGANSHLAILRMRLKISG